MWLSQKAFDSISHGILIEKLKIIGFDSEAQNLIKSFLSNRLHRVKLYSIYSKWIKVVRGVYQGIVLEPLLFNLYVNDLCTAIDTDVTMIQCADDCLVFASNKDEKVAKKSLVSNIHNLANYFSEHQLNLNSSKTSNKMIKQKQKPGHNNSR